VSSLRNPHEKMKDGGGVSSVWKAFSKQHLSLILMEQMSTGIESAHPADHPPRTVG
jgi:hypothetical protein